MALKEYASRTLSKITLYPLQDGCGALGSFRCLATTLLTFGVQVFLLGKHSIYLRQTGLSRIKDL